MVSKLTFQGSMVALVTPLGGDGTVDFAALERLVDFHVANKTDAIVSVGTTGESATLEFDEHCAVMERTLQHANGRIPIIAGTGANSTKEAIELTRAAAKIGADACLLVVPYYNKPTQEGLYLHFKAIAEAVDIPQILYNVPGRTACDMLNDTVLRLADIENIVGLKDATGDIPRAKELIERLEGRITVFSGDDGTALEHMLVGGKGDISVTANVAPALMHEMCTAAIAGNEAEARAINDRLADLHRDLFVEANPIPVKWALYEMGLIGPDIRLPLTPLAAEYHERVRAAMSKAGII